MKRCYVGDSTGEMTCAVLNMNHVHDDKSVCITVTLFQLEYSVKINAPLAQRVVQRYSLACGTPHGVATDSILWGQFMKFDSR